MGQCHSTSAATASEASSRALSSTSSSFKASAVALPVVRTSAKEAHHEPSGLTIGTNSLDSHSANQLLRQVEASSESSPSKKAVKNNGSEKSQNMTNSADRKNTPQYQSRRRKKQEQKTATTRRSTTFANNSAVTKTSPLRASTPALRLVPSLPNNGAAKRDRRGALQKENSWFHMTYMMDSSEHLDDDANNGEPPLERHEEEQSDEEEDALSALDASSWGELDTAIVTPRRRSSTASSMPDRSFSKDVSRNTCSTQDMSVSMVVDYDNFTTRERYHSLTMPDSSLLGGASDWQ